MSMLNLIVTHYDEPWELGRPFFDMLEHQKSVDMSQIDITLVQDGSEHALPWKELLSNYHYKVKLITIPHSGTASARNAGLKACTADWVMFCNFDDSLADIASLSMMTENFPNDDYDLIWMKIVQQCKWFTGHIYLNCVKTPNFANTDGKMYRTQFLREHDIWFHATSDLYYDHIFNAIVLAIVAPFRIVMLTTEIYPYAKTYRANALRHTPEAFDNLTASVLQREKIIASELYRRDLTFAFQRSICKAICNEYYSTYSPDRKENKDSFSPGFLDFYNTYRFVFDKVKPSDIESIKSEAEIEQLEIIQSRYNEHKQEYYFKNDTISFDAWIAKLNGQDIQTINSSSTHDTPVPDAPVASCDVVYEDADTAPVEITVPDDIGQRVVVYCGTYDVYLNMIASAKSLLCTTPVDKVFFVCEDDTFPYDIPDIIQTINVKNQSYFHQDGPNFNNSWTYMCMIRAAFPQMFSQYSRILSLDIDIVVTEDVSDLWDYDLTDYYLAGVPEKQRQKSSADPIYINFGVVMMNLDKLRNDNIQPQLIDALNSKHFGCPEQDAFNSFCAGKILELPADFNYTTYSHITGDAQRERILHYAGQKFWRHYSVVKQFSDLGWNEVMRRQNSLKAGDNIGNQEK